MAKKLLMIPLFMMCMSAVDGFALSGRNPFIEKKPEEKIEKQLRYPSFVQRLIGKLGSLQRKLNKKITELSRKLKKEQSLQSFLFLLFIAFIYGVIHAVGPGHGKIIAGSYFLSNRASVKKGILLGFSIAFTHAASAMIIVLSGYLILKQAVSATFENYSRIIRLVSAVLIFSLGMILLSRKLFFRKKLFFRTKRSPSDKSRDAVTTNRTLLSIAFAVGIVPCPGALLVLLFSIHMQLLILGLILTLVMALGMAVTLSLVGAVVITARNGTLRIASTKNSLRNVLQAGIQIVGAGFVVLVGLFLFLANL